jgi:hypothetical protein
VTDVAVFKYISCRIRIGIQQDKQGIYPDQNKVSRILPLDDATKSPTAKQSAGDVGPTVATAAKPATEETVPPWRRQQTRPATTPSQDLKDEVPY